MNAAERWPEVKALFEAAQEIEPTARDQWLSARCTGDPVLLSEVQSLFAFDRHPHPVFSRSPLALASLLDDDSDDLEADDVIGPYRIERLLGHGGMGAVYLADRSDADIRQRVAIKVIKRGMDTAEIVRRFRIERQTLATLNHPNIATLLDAGRTSDAVPYFVMEYVEGEPIVAYCQRRGLPIQARLRLMLRVCAAIQHAHRHLVVHRDLKPDNVLVRADGEPKLLDFGIAKLLEGEGAGATMTGARPMTLRYASPEQIRGEAVSTVTDIYSLGVLLYEVLTGRMPYATDTVAGPVIERAICEDAPLPLRTATAREVPRDLEAIVLTTLRKEPERRYASVEQLAADLRRFLDGLPVNAQRDTLRYRTSKFVRRNRLAVAAAVLAAVGLTGAAGVTTWQAGVARHEAAVAIENARIAEVERQKARAEATRAEHVSTFLKSVLQLPDPSWHAAGAGGPRDMTVLDLLSAASKRVDTDLRGHPDVAADIHHTLGNTYRALGLFDDAARHYDISLRQRRALYGDRHIKVAASLYMQHAIHVAFKRSDEALALLREAVRIARTVPAEDMPDLLPHLLTDLAGALQQRGRLDEAEPAGAEALETFRRRYGDEHLTVAYAKRALANIRRSREDRAGAETLLREAAATIARLSPPKSNNLSGILEDLGVLAIERGANDEAGALFRDAYGREVATLGADHPSVTHNLGLQATAETAARRHADAERLARSALELTRRRYGRGNPATLGSVQTVVHVLMHAGKERQAETYIREGLRIRSAHQPGDLCEIAKLRLTLAWSLAAQSRAGSVPLAREAYPSMVRECRSTLGYASTVAAAQPMMARYFPSVLTSR